MTERLHFRKVVLAVANVLHIVSFHGLFLTQEPSRLGTGDVKGLAAAMSVASHTGP